MQAIEGFPLTSENYIEAWNLLNDRYGNEQYIIACDMEKLVKLKPVIHPGVKDLRKLYDTIASHVRSLKQFGDKLSAIRSFVNSNYFGKIA